MRHQKKKSLAELQHRSAFTLVEMMVSVTLVLLMMTLFASIFQMATGTMGTQRAISEHDQRARSLVTVIRGDFQRRTMRYPFAFYPGEDSATSVTSFSNRAGYFYLSTNDPYSGLDDHIQFTVSANILSENPDDTPFYGLSTWLRDRRTDGPAITEPNRVSLARNTNQPETDDGSIAANSLGTSPAAEISYFVRNGNLYRRVLLIREPMGVSGQNLAPQPTSRSGYNYFSGQPDTTDQTTYDGLFEPTSGPGLSGALTNDFYRLFDYSAYASFPVPGQQRTEFLGVASLGNETIGAANQSLGFPNRRFGFNPVTGFCREHTVHPDGGVPKFIGSFLHAETSTLNFNWPQSTSRNEPASATNPGVPDSNQVLQVDLDYNGSLESTTNGNPFDLNGCPLTLNSGNGLVSSFDGATVGEGRGGLRRMEDLLLSNVHEMRVELWDERLQRYVTPGHQSVHNVTGQRGDFHVSRCLNHEYRVFNGASAVARTSIGRVYDSWHPSVALDFNGDLSVAVTERNPPYMPYRFYPPIGASGPPVPLTAGVPAPLAPNSEDARNRGYWAPSTTYAVGDVVFLPWIDAPTVSPPGPPDGVFQYSEHPEPGFNIAYRCIVAGTSNVAMDLSWPSAAGRKKSESGGSPVIWESFDNRRPLRSIRLQVRFYDKKSESMRQVSLVIPMNEE